VKYLKMSNPDGASKQIGQVMDMHFSIVYSGWCFKTSRTTVLSMHFIIVKSGWCFKQIGQQYCPPCTSKLSNPDGASKQIVKFLFELIFLKMFISETYQFSRKIPGKGKFLQKFPRKLSRKRKFSRNKISQNFAKICSFSHHFRFS
jgi:hypothetical protein